MTTLIDSPLVPYSELEHMARIRRDRLKESAMLVKVARKAADLGPEYSRIRREQSREMQVLTKLLREACRIS